MKKIYCKKYQSELLENPKETIFPPIKLEYSDTLDLNNLKESTDELSGNRIANAVANFEKYTIDVKLKYRDYLLKYNNLLTEYINTYDNKTKLVKYRFNLEEEREIYFTKYNQYLNYLDSVSKKHNKEELISNVKKYIPNEYLEDLKLEEQNELFESFEKKFNENLGNSQIIKKQIKTSKILYTIANVISIFTGLLAVLIFTIPFLLQTIKIDTKKYENSIYKDFFESVEKIEKEFENKILNPIEEKITTDWIESAYYITKELTYDSLKLSNYAPSYYSYTKTYKYKLDDLITPTAAYFSYLVISYAVVVLVLYCVSGRFNRRKGLPYHWKTYTIQYVKNMNEIYNELFNHVQVKILNQYIDNVKIPQLNNEFMDIYTFTLLEIVKVKNEYNNSENILPKKVIAMYDQLEEEEREMFITLGKNAESIKEFSNILIECKKLEDSRKSKEAYQKQLLEAEKQTRYAKDAAEDARRRVELESQSLAEQQRQTEILREQAAQQASYNAEMLKKQEEANKLAKKLSKDNDKLNKTLEEAGEDRRAIRDKYGL